MSTGHKQELHKERELQDRRDLRKREYILVYSSRGLRGHDGRVEAEGPAEDLLGGRSRKLGVPIINSKYRAERVPEVG